MSLVWKNVLCWMIWRHDSEFAFEITFTHMTGFGILTHREGRSGTPLRIYLSKVTLALFVAFARDRESRFCSAALLSGRDGRGA